MPIAAVSEASDGLLLTNHKLRGDVSAAAALLVAADGRVIVRQRDRAAVLEA
jgi:hypothetical protein